MATKGRVEEKEGENNKKKTKREKKKIEKDQTKLKRRVRRTFKITLQLDV